MTIHQQESPFLWPELPTFLSEIESLCGATHEVIDLVEKSLIQDLEQQSWQAVLQTLDRVITHTDDVCLVFEHLYLPPTISSFKLIMAAPWIKAQELSRVLRGKICRQDSATAQLVHLSQEILFALQEGIVAATRGQQEIRVLVLSCLLQEEVGRKLTNVQEKMNVLDSFEMLPWNSCQKLLDNLVGLRAAVQHITFWLNISPCLQIPEGPWIDAQEATRWACNHTAAYRSQERTMSAQALGKRQSLYKLIQELVCRLQKMCTQTKEVGDQILHDLQQKEGEEHV